MPPVLWAVSDEMWGTGFSRGGRAEMKVYLVQTEVSRGCAAQTWLPDTPEGEFAPGVGCGCGLCLFGSLQAL